MNVTNYADKWKDTQTTCADVSHHRRKHVHVFTWGGWARLQLSTVLQSTLAQSKQCTRFHRRKHSWAETGMENRADRKQRPLKWTTRRGWWVGMGAESMTVYHLRKEESSKYSKVKKRHMCASPEPKKASRAFLLRTWTLERAVLKPCFTPEMLP